MFACASLLLSTVVVVVIIPAGAPLTPLLLFADRRVLHRPRASKGGDIRPAERQHQGRISYRHVQEIRGDRAGGDLVQSEEQKAPGNCQSCFRDGESRQSGRAVAARHVCYGKQNPRGAGPER